MNAKSIISVTNLQYQYPDGTQALCGVDLQVNKGEKLALMGPNGSGKSTFFLCLNGVYRPSQGTIYYNDQPIGYSRIGLLALREKVGIVFQDPDYQLFSADTYGEISFGPLNLGLPESEVRQRVEQVIKELHITSFQDKPTHLLSGGQKKIVAIADILVMEPNVIILDEPAAALDPKHVQLIDEVLDQFSAQGLTVIIATHDVNRALEWADSVALFSKGKILMKEAPEIVFQNQNLLEQVNLKQPEVIKLFTTLVDKGILNKKLPLPHSMKALEAYIQSI